MSVLEFNRPELSGTPPQPAEDPAFDGIVEGYLKDGRKLVERQYEEFEDLVAKAASLSDRGNLRHAAAAAQMAANFGVFWHPGMFFSPRLERTIRNIGRAAIPYHPKHFSERQGERRAVLHIATQIGGIGGHARMMWRWISRDADTCHSVALTRQTEQIPKQMRDAIAACGGSVHFVNARLGGLLSWAQTLQREIAKADLVVLHVHNQDIIPFLALAGMSAPPPVALLNHADHVFWVGSTFADHVINTRFTGFAICAERRGIGSRRNHLLPICLDALETQIDKATARTALGLPPDSVVLLTIARSVKFRALGEQSFADAIVPVLQRNPRAILLAVGPAGVVDWSRAQKAAPGQIVIHPERPDTENFYAAADIYVDSFPFASNTSLIEAGLNGLPLVTRFPFGAGCDIMGADSLGIDETLVKATCLADFQRDIEHMVRDTAHRHALGRKTRETIEAVNTGRGWDQALLAIYDAVSVHIPSKAVCSIREAPQFDRLDCLAPFMFGAVLETSTARNRMAYAKELAIKTFPPARRIAAWADMGLRREFVFRKGFGACRTLVPEWLTVRTRRLSAR